MRLDEHELIGYERDDLHRETARHQGNRLLQTQQWDPAGRLHAQLLSRSDDKSALLKRDYKYDAAGQLTDLNDSRRGPLAYRYDLVGRLLEATSRGCRNLRLRPGEQPAGRENSADPKTAGAKPQTQQTDG